MIANDSTRAWIQGYCEHGLGLPALARKSHFPFQYVKSGTVRHRSPEAAKNGGISDGIFKAHINPTIGGFRDSCSGVTASSPAKLVTRQISDHAG